jgi:hypothetical protein
MANYLCFALSLFSALVASFLGLQLQYTNAARIEVPMYEVDELNPESGLVVSGTQFIEYPDGQTKVEIPYNNENKKAWINVEAYLICVQDDQESTRQSAEFLGQLLEQQDNETAAAYYEELLKSKDADGMDTCIKMNGEYAMVYGIPN